MTQATYPLTPYTLVYLDPLLEQLNQMGKKDRGLGRFFKRLIDVVARPSIGGEQVIDFSLQLEHFNPGDKVVADWYSRVVSQMTNTAEFDLCAMLYVYRAYEAAYDWLHAQEERAWMRDSLFVRFEQQAYTERATSQTVTRLMPVVSVLLPTKHVEWVATQKVQYVALLNVLAGFYTSARVEQTFLQTLNDPDLNKVSEFFYQIKSDVLAASKVYCWEASHDRLTPSVQCFKSDFTVQYRPSHSFL